MYVDAHEPSLGARRAKLSPEYASKESHCQSHFNMSVLSQNPTYIQYVFIHKNTYMPEPGCSHLHVLHTFTFTIRPKMRVVVGTLRVWSFSRLTFLRVCVCVCVYEHFVRKKITYTFVYLYMASHKLIFNTDIKIQRGYIVNKSSFSFS